MRDIVTFAQLDRPVAGICPVCGMSQVLSRRVVYYRRFAYSVCQVCGRGLERHIRWLAEARRRYLQNRILRAQEGE
jgi:transcription elongation factor Elf1